LEAGFCRLRCGKCGISYFLAYSCRGRCFCPSCSKKRQVAFAEFLTEHILEDVPYRHANFTLPRRLRRHFYFNRKLLSKLARCAYQTLRQAIQQACGPVTPGAVSVVHTAGSLLDFHPHVHLLVTSGGWLESGGFVQAPGLAPDALERLFQHHVFRLLLNEQALPEHVVQEMLQWHPTGFDAFIGHPIDGSDTRALEHLAQYMAKGPLALDRLSYTEGGQARYRATKVHPRHGAYRDFDPLEFLGSPP
jgi:hypothetical protein